MSSSSPRFSIDALASPRSQQPAYPFPPSPDLNRQSFGNRYAPRRGSTSSTLSATSVGGALDPQSGRRGSTARETSQNAISTLLQPPIVRTGLLPHTQASAAAAGFKAPTTKDIPPVTLTNIPHVPPESFRDYLQRIGPLFERFQRGRAEPEQTPQWLKKDRELEKTDRFAEALERRLSKEAGPPSPSLTRQTSTTIFSPVETPGQGSQRRRSSAQGRRNRNEPTPLSTIPDVYFHHDFHLENPRTFDIVTERAEIVRPPPGTPPTEQKAANGTPLPPRKALATNAILQEKLSWYMDTVEVHLINNISTASTGFFAALGSLKELQTEAEESVAKIQSLRKDLRRLDQEVAVGGLEVAAKRRRRANVRRLGQATKQVQRVVEDVKKADGMVEEGLFDEAADQMDRVGRLVCGLPSYSGREEDELIDLRPLKALQGLDSGLQDLQYRIGAGFAQRFTNILLADLRQHVQTVPKAQTLKRWSRQRGVPPTYMETSPQLRQDLLAALKGLSRAGHMAPATSAYRDAVIKEMKALIKTSMPSSNDDDADSMVSTSTSTRGGKTTSRQEKSSILARNLRALDEQDAESMLIGVYTAVGEALRRVSTQTKVLLDVTSSMQPTEPPKRPNLEEPQQQQNGAPLPPQMHSRTPSRARATSSAHEELSHALDMSSLLGQAVDTAQSQITRVLKVRNEQSVRLQRERFLRYFTLNRLFVDECEAVSGRGGKDLRAVIDAQIKGFVQASGEREMETVKSRLDGEEWNAVDFKARDDAVLQRVLGSISADPAAWTTGAASPIWEDVSAQHADETPRQANGDTAASTNGTSTPTTNGTPAPATKIPQAKPALIDDNRYILVASAIALLPTIDTFLSLTTSFPSMTPAISTALLDVLRTFNSRSCQLILGAGATRSAGLKNITTKHLALASQALSFVIAMVPYMRECVRRHLPAGAGQGSNLAVLAEWDKTKRLYQDHQVGIHDKLVEIMTSRSSAHIKALNALDFDNANAAEEGKVSPYMETLTKETLTLHRVLARHLGEVDVEMIMRQIFAAYREQWSKAFGEVRVESEQGRKRLLRDAECFDGRLGKVEMFGTTGKAVLDIVRGRVEQKREQVEEEKR